MRIMMLGAGHCQLNAIERLENEMGLQVVAADYYDDAPGKALSTFKSNASTFDVKACMETAVKFEVDGVMTTGTDQPVYTAAAISESLGLRYFFDSGKALDVTDKKRMKTIMDKHTIINLKLIAILFNAAIALRSCVSNSSTSTVVVISL